MQVEQSISSAEPQSGGDAPRVIRLNILTVEKASATRTLVAEVLRELASQVARSQASRDLLQLSGEERTGDRYKEALGKVKDCMKEIMAETWRTNAEFVRCIHDTVGPNMEEHLGADTNAILLRHSTRGDTEHTGLAFD